MGRAALMLALVAASAMACGGTSLLTRNRFADAPWRTFAEARAVYDRVEPGVTTLPELHALGLNPESGNTSTVLTYVEVEETFAPHEGLSLLDADPAVLRCVRVRQACRVWKIDASRRTRRRVGNFLLDWLLFRRTSRTVSWRFEALILLESDRVVYKIWSGEPQNVALRDRIRPLGIAQDVFDAVRLGAVALAIEREVR